MFENIEYNDIAERIKTDIAVALPGANPRIFISFVKALAVSNAGRHYDNILLLEQAIVQMFPQTATGTFLKYWLQLEGLEPFEEIQGLGFMTITGEIDTVIPEDNQFKTNNEIYIQPLFETVCTLQEFEVTSLIRNGNTVTGITLTENSFASGLTVTIAGADQAEYNGDQVVTVLNGTTFSFTIEGLPVSPATGTITASYIGANIAVEAVEFGTDGNLDAGTPLRSLLFIDGLDDFGYIQYLGMTGGTNAESEDSIRRRTIQSRANPVANFNVAAIEKQAFLVPDVTRVFVLKITPGVGQVTIAFMRDGFPNPIPTSGEIVKVKESILEILPATSDENDIFVIAPDPVYVNFTFTALVPNTAILQSEITKNLQSFFADNNYVTYQKNVDEDAYRSAIFNAIDTNTGQSIQTFTLSLPLSGDVVIGNNQIALLNSIIFSI